MAQSSNHVVCALIINANPFPLPSGKVHGSLARAGKVRGQTPKVAKQEKPKKPRGRAAMRLKYNRRYVNAVVGPGKKRGPNSSSK
ncbi:40S ribosomal protein S30 [Gracilariopsis chorda]|uniref:40S ribosomal protein S30 n=1 Tax=Gracilariopsis chorda TaxID=448386 RepID=A0A2V3J869_9FLOR|nr:40S ribosomal protein S30 [Gracilariopsis chorda]|eukprot:PXF49350.1 40S ribosomal protein S30 [Gracilariopsis chorda]